MTELLQIHPSDTVAVAVRGIRSGDPVPIRGHTICAPEDVPAGHKICIVPTAAGGTVVKYGFPIGTATRDIRAGQWVHTHNLKSALTGVREYSYERPGAFPRARPSGAPQTFPGFPRGTGRAGIRNEVWILPTVGCVNSVARAIEARARGMEEGSVDGIHAFGHPYGCSQLGEDLDHTRRILCGLIRHPNAGGVLVLGLGCETDGVGELKKALGPFDPDRVKFLVCQDCPDEIEEGLSLIGRLCRFAGRFRREPVPMSELVVGLKCGGSDGFSGITANRLLGAFTDRLVAEGGSAVLSEVPEMFGAETILLGRCVSEEAFGKTAALINHFKEYFLKNGGGISDNPSPGNKEGGITTLEEKSLGCVQKGGHAPVVDAVRYGRPVEKRGLTLLQTPGNDLVSASAEAAAGAQLILFTTGRGTPFGCPVPTLKISSNTKLSRAKKNWIDLNAGDLIEGASVEEKTESLYGLVRSVASGEIRTKSEIHGMRDLAIFKNGITL